MNIAIGSITKGKPRRIRIGVLGAARSGKTTLITRMVYKRFSECYIPTVEDLHTKYVDLGKDTSKRIEFLDTAGSYSFPAMRRLAINTCHMFLLVYAVDDAKSLYEALDLHKEITRVKNDAPVLIVGNKIDLNRQHAFSEQEMNKLTDSYSVNTMDLFAASAKQDLNIEDVWGQLLSRATLDIEPDMHAAISSRRRSSIKSMLFESIAKLFKRRYSAP